MRFLVTCAVVVVSLCRGQLVDVASSVDGDALPPVATLEEVLTGAGLGDEQLALLVTAELELDLLRTLTPAERSEDLLAAGLSVGARRKVLRALDALDAEVKAARGPRLLSEEESGSGDDASRRRLANARWDDMRYTRNVTALKAHLLVGYDKRTQPPGAELEVRRVARAPVDARDDSSVRVSGEDSQSLRAMSSLPARRCRSRSSRHRLTRRSRRSRSSAGGASIGSTSG